MRRDAPAAGTRHPISTCEPIGRNVPLPRIGGKGLLPKDEKIQKVGKYAAALSIIEVALGSILHSFRIPFSGNFLSLNQGYLLCRASLDCRGDGPSVAYSISNVAAVLKSLAPAGKKLGPMLSLSMQGFLFSFGLWLGRETLLGYVLGMVLLSLWTFIQPFLTYYLFFGSELFLAIQYLFEKTIPYHGLNWWQLSLLLGSLILTKALIAAGLALWVWRTNGQSHWQDNLLQFAKAKGVRPLEGKGKVGSPLLLALKDLFQPLFLISIGITAFFLYFSQHAWGEKIWILLRPLAIGYLFFYFSRTLTLERWLQKMQQGRFASFAYACEQALNHLRPSTVQSKAGKTTSAREEISESSL